MLADEKLPYCILKNVARFTDSHVEVQENTSVQLSSACSMPFRSGTKLFCHSTVHMSSWHSITWHNMCQPLAGMPRAGGMHLASGKVNILNIFKLMFLVVIGELKHILKESRNEAH